MGGADLGLLAEVVLGRNRLLELAGPGLLGRQGLFSLRRRRHQVLVVERDVTRHLGQPGVLGLQVRDLLTVAGREARDGEQGGQGDDGTTDGVEKVHVGSPLRTQ